MFFAYPSEGGKKHTKVILEYHLRDLRVLRGLTISIEPNIRLDPVPQMVHGISG